MKKAAAIIAAIAFAAATAAPALAQNSAEEFARRLTGKAPLGIKAWPVGYNVPVVNPKADPWIAMSSAQMAATQFGADAKRPYGVSAQLDYNGDGIMDSAFLANNRSQGAVIVRLGGGKGDVVAFRARKRWAGGQEIAAAGRRIVLSYPESSVVILSAESGRPAVYYVPEGDD